MKKARITVANRTRNYFVIGERTFAELIKDAEEVDRG
jgi:hypothetical protein